MSGMSRAVVSSQRPGLEAHRESIELEITDIVERLRDMVGPKLVAYVGNVKNTRPVGDWAAGRRSPGSEDEKRLRLAFQAARVLSERYSPTNIQAWMIGSNPALGFESPARAIRDSDNVADIVRDVMSAATSFAYVG
ncbi:DUF2384 domain-containing protein (plasmid) [Leifsonia sp. P73]|uniref:hypothetical protein n=1 Tax=unclassified Leifsonia TaxID=2663824 RepID=UPI00370489F0